MTVRFTLEALDHIVEISSYIRTKSPRAATRIVEHVFAECDRLGKFPQLGHVGIVTGLHEWRIPHLPFIIVYDITDRRGVIILGFYHAAQNR